MALEDMDVGQLRWIARNKGWDINDYGSQQQMVNFIRDIESFQKQSREVKREYRKVERTKQKKVKGKRKKRK